MVMRANEIVLFVFFKQNRLRLLQYCNIKDEGLEAIKSLASAATLLDVS